MAQATLKLGATGPDVEHWQKLLTAAGFPTDVTGTFDKATETHTKEWQKSKNIGVDGVVGNESWSTMLGTVVSTVSPSDVAKDIASVPGLAEHTDNAFRWALVNMAARLKTNPDYIAAAMAVETGKTFSAQAENPLSHAIGLIQFMPNGSAATLTGLKTGIGAESGYAFLKSMTPIAQLKYVEAYFKPFTGKMNNPNDAYLAVFYPSAMGKPDGHVIAETPSKVYEQNKGFDTAKKGYITAGDVGAAAKWMLNQAAKKARIPVNPEPGSTDGGASGGGGKAGLIALAVTFVGIGIAFIVKGLKRR